jgi:hypothetical protein
MTCYRVVVLDENQKVLISKIVTDEGPKEVIADRIQVIIGLHRAPFTVSVTDYIHESMNCFEFMKYLHTALSEMSLRGD